MTATVITTRTETGPLIDGATGKWEIVIGMEVHAQVLSKAKLFSGASAEFGADPNDHVSFVDAAMPGMLPVINRQARFTGTPNYTGSTVPALAQPLFTSAINQRLATQNGNEANIGDLEVSSLLHWEIGDSQTVTFAPTLVMPTGDYDAKRRVNAGYGRYYTFRPSVQYAYIGDGWDVGARSVFSFNTRNTGTGYYSGNMFNLDWQLMKFVSDDVRVGVQGYFVRQLSRDTQDLSKFSATDQQILAKEIVNGNKASVNAIGPAVAWLKNGGEMLLEGKFLREFNARNRTEGQAFWLTVSKPL